MAIKQDTQKDLKDLSNFEICKRLLEAETRADNLNDPGSAASFREIERRLRTFENEQWDAKRTIRSLLRKKTVVEMTSQDISGILSENTSTSTSMQDHCGVSLFVAIGTKYGN